MTENKLNPHNILAHHYNFDPASITTDQIKEGIENENYLVNAPSGKFVLRIYNQAHSARGERSLKLIQQEMMLVEKSRQAGIPVPQVIENKNGDTITVFQIEHQTRYCALFPFIEGNLRSGYSQKSSEEVGKVVNTLFTVSHSFDDDSQQLHYDVLTYAFKKYDAVRQQVADQRLHQLYERLQSERDNLSLEGVSRGLIHGDIKPGNLLFDDDENLLAVLDFDDFRYSYLLEDAVMALLHNLHSDEENMLRAGFYQPFIEQITEPQFVQELPLLPFFLRVRFLYDVSSYLENSLFDLVDSLFLDKEIQKYLLDA